MDEDCTFNPASRLMTGEQVSQMQEAVLGPSVLLIELLAALAGISLLTRINLDEEHITMLELAQEFEKKRPKKRTATQEKCVVKTMGRCSCRGFAESEELAKKLRDNARFMEKSLRKYLAPAPIAANRQIAQFNGAYARLIFEIQNCVDKTIDRKIIKDVEYCNSGEYKMALRCVEKREIEN